MKKHFYRTIVRARRGVERFCEAAQRTFYVRLLPLVVKKDNVECPCCGWKGARFLRRGTISHFLPFLHRLGINLDVAKLRKNARCPGCGSLERHRLYYLYLKEHIPSDRELKVLHVAPQKALTDLFLSCGNVSYLSADKDPGKAMVEEDLADMSFEDGSFDIVFCSHVLEHVEDDMKALREIHRLLRPGGFAVLQVPLSGGTTHEDPNVRTKRERARVFGCSDHVRRYGGDYAERLRKAGFDVREDDLFEKLEEGFVRRHVLRREVIYRCCR